jgi:single-strand DNA-binding protein
MINLVQLGGCLKDDPELFDARSGALRAEFTLVVSNVRYDPRSGGPMIEPVFIRCIAWETTAEVVGPLSKGTVVMIQGQLTQQEVTDNAGRKERKTKVQALTVQVIRTPPGDRGRVSSELQRLAGTPPGDDTYPG